MSLLMILVTSEKFSLEKFDFLVREKEADIRMVSTENKTFNTQSGAEQLLAVLQYEEAQEVLSITPNFLLDLSTKILGASNSPMNVFLECFNYVSSLESQTLESLFFPSHIFNFKHKVSSIFEVIPHDSDLFEIIADKAFQLIGKEEKRLTSLVHLLRVHAKKVYEGGNTTDLSLKPDVKKTLLSLFMTFFEKLQLPSVREQSGFTAALEDWRDRYGMTFLMRLLVDNSDVESADSNNPAVDLLIRTIIEEKIFDNEYIDTKAEVALGPQFDLQHRLGIASTSKKRNTVILEGQIVEMKRVERRNIETGLYEPIVPDKDGQVKMISKKRIKVNDDGPERETRVMLTVKKQDQREKFKETTESENSFDLDAVSLDGDQSDASEDKLSLDLPEEELETKINHWSFEDVKSIVSHDSTDDMPSLDNSKDNIGTENPQRDLNEIRPRIVEPEHFDKTSILTESKETFMTKENRYKYAPSASTRYVETHSEVESPNKYFAKRTTLLLLACRIKKWALVESILDKYTPNVNHKDAQGSNALHLTIKANNADMCKNMINRIRKNELKSEVDIDGKTALKLMTEMILNGSAHDEFDYLEEKILNITGQKKNPYRKTSPQVVVDKTKEQKLQLYMGHSCGFSFECQKPPVWTCRGNICGVEVTLEKDLTFADLNHYSRHACNTEVRVKYKKGKIHIDQFKFECEDESDTDEIEVWSCMAEGCDATIKVDAEDQLFIKALGLHNCQTSLKMEVDKNYGMLDGHVFWKNPGDSTWYCDDQCCKRAGCKITTVGEGLVLRYPHTEGMHKRKEHRQAAEKVPADKGFAMEDDDDDAGFSGMFE